MRIGVSSRGNAWMSMGCLGWLFIGPFILAAYLLVIGVQLLVWLCVAVARAGSAAVAAQQRRKALH